MTPLQSLKSILFGQCWLNITLSMVDLIHSMTQHSLESLSLPCCLTHGFISYDALSLILVKSKPLFWYSLITWPIIGTAFSASAQFCRVILSDGGSSLLDGPFTFLSPLDCFIFSRGIVSRNKHTQMTSHVCLIFYKPMVVFWKS